MDYEEIHEYEHLKQDKEKKPYENNEVVDKIYVSLKPAVMETVRDQIQSNVSEFNVSIFTTPIAKASQY